MPDDVQFMSGIVNWIERNLKANPGCREVAGRAGYSLRHLQRKFAQGTGVPLVAYIRARRLTQAAVLLRLSYRPVGGIASEWGYSSHHTFTRASGCLRSVTASSTAGCGCARSRLSGRGEPESKGYATSRAFLTGWRKY